jgi:hypothetical protein
VAGGVVVAAVSASDVLRWEAWLCGWGAFYVAFTLVFAVVVLWPRCGPAPWRHYPR